MTRFSLLIAAAAIVGFSGVASAGVEPEPPMGNAYGVHGCGPKSTFDEPNPGKYFQALKETDWPGLNPAEVADGAGLDSTADLIATFCGADEVEID